MRDAGFCLGEGGTWPLWWVWRVDIQKYICRGHVESADKVILRLGPRNQSYADQDHVSSFILGLLHSKYSICSPSPLQNMLHLVNPKKISTNEHLEFDHRSCCSTARGYKLVCVICRESGSTLTTVIGKTIPYTLTITVERRPSCATR